MKNPTIVKSLAVKKANVLSMTLICVFLSTAVVLSSCEKSDFDYIDEQSIGKTSLSAIEPDSIAKNTLLNQIPLGFSLTINNCFAGGISVSVNIENPKEYTFLWEVDGNHGGHDVSTLPCLCGTTAKVYITHLETGAMLSKSIALPSCADEIK